MIDTNFPVPEFFYEPYFAFSLIFIALILFFLESRQVKKILDSNAESSIIHINTFAKKYFLIIRLVFCFFIIINLYAIYNIFINPYLMVTYFAACFLVFNLAFWDLCLKAIKNYQNIIFFILSLIILFLYEEDMDLFITYLIVFAFFIVIYLVSKFYFKKEAIGVADIIFVPSLLPFLGSYFWSASLIVGCLIALIVALIHRVKYGVKLESVPLIFYIALGFCFAVLYVFIFLMFM